MNERHQPVLQALVRLARPEILRAFSPDSCIASTAIAIEVLRTFGMSSHPLTVEVSVFNAPYLDFLRREGRPPQTAAAVERWLQAGCHLARIERGVARPGRWPGHLVAIAERRWLVDLSIDQVNRPQYGMLLQPLASPVEPAFLAGRQNHTVHVGSLLLSYTAWPRDRSFRRSANWSQPGHRQPTVDQIVHAMTRELQQTTSTSRVGRRPQSDD